MKAPKGDKQFYVSWYRLDGQDRYLLWWTSDQTDAVWVDAAGQIPTFETIAQAQAFEQQLGMPVKDEKPILQDLDLVKQWLRKPTSQIDAEVGLMGWNFFTDAAEGTGRRFAGQRGKVRRAWRGGVYDKLFFGTSTGMLLAPAGTPRYVPQWNKDELKFIAKVLTQGMKIFRRHVYLAT